MSLVRNTPHGDKAMKKAAWLSVLFTLAMILGGCTATYTTHWPGKWNAMERHEAGHTEYKRDGTYNYQ